MDHLNKDSLDLTKENIEKLKKIFPNIITDGKIDFEMLRVLLGENIDSSTSKYQFNWNGKNETIKNAQSSSSATLIPSFDRSLNWNNTENLYIEGDNLEVLKLLQKTYFGKIKMIYIDPPYNTGHDFIYNDDYSNSKKDYKEITGQAYRANAETNGRYHTDWLNMMYSRLMLAKNLLTDDGVIFISIDEHEIINLNKICNEIFGEYNFVENFIWIKNSTKNNSLTTSTNHEYIVCYSKNIDSIKEKDKMFRIKKYGKQEVDELKRKYLESVLVPDHKELESILNKFYKDHPEYKGVSAYHYVDEKFRIYASDNMSAPGGGGPVYDVIHPITKKPCKVSSRGWLYKPETMAKLIENDQVLFGVDETTVPRLKKFLDSVDTDVVKSVIENNDDGEKEVRLLFEQNKSPFENPKPASLMSYLIDMLNDDNMIVLDFFSGSGTTAQAVFENNFKNLRNNKFILVQLPERISEKDDAFKLGFEKISDLAIARIKLYINSIKNNENLGFKVFKIDSTNIKPWDGTVKLSDFNLLDLNETIKEDRTNLDVAYEIMLKYGIFNMPLKKVQINNKTMYNIGEGYMIICLDNDITSKDVIEIANLKPHCVVFKEQGFADDNEKINATYTLKRLGVEDVKCI